jgi:hypothetical protein
VLVYLVVAELLLLYLLLLALCAESATLDPAHRSPLITDHKLLFVWFV